MAAKCYTTAHSFSPNGFIMLDMFSRLDVRISALRLGGLEDENANGLSDHFRGGIAKNSLGSIIQW